MKRKPTVLTQCVANTYTGPNERIIEFNDRDASEPTGGLISFTRMEDGTLLVYVYRQDPTVVVSVAHGTEVVRIEAPKEEDVSS